VVKPVKMEPKKSTVSYARVAQRDVTVKQRVDSNHLAYRAWAERNGKWKRKDTCPNTPSHEKKLGQGDKNMVDLNAWVTVSRRKIPIISL
jgi:hypothetical protein